MVALEQSNFIKIRGNNFYRFGRAIVYAGQVMNVTSPCDDCEGLCVRRTTNITTSVDVCMCEANSDTRQADGCSTITPTCGKLHTWLCLYHPEFFMLSVL